MRKISKSVLYGVAAVSIALSSFFLGRISSTNPVVSAKQEDVLPAKSSMNINRTFDFPITNDSGNKVGEFKYTINNAELRNQIVVKGQKATAIKGRTFLILNLKIDNPTDERVEINARNYIRLSINDSSELYAPDIHNDPIEVQAKSVKETRVGFAINNSYKKLQLQVGEISGNKTSVDLKL